MTRKTTTIAWATLMALGCTPQESSPGDTEADTDVGSTTSSASDDGEDTVPGSSGVVDTGPVSEGSDTSAGDSSGDDESSGDDTTTGGVMGQTIVVAVGNWGHRGMTVDGERWVEISNDPPPDGNDHTPDLLRGVGYGDGQFVAVGGDANGMVMTTIDGVTWDEDLYPEGTGWLGDVAYLDGIWVAVGGNGIVVRSTDGGVQWSENIERLDSAGRRIIAAEGKFVAAGDNGLIAVSTDGLAWDQSYDPSTLGFSIAHGLDTFVGFASQWNGSGFDTACITSDDAMSWSPCPITSDSFGTPASGDGVLVVDTGDGYAWTSDGTNWNESGDDFPSRAVYGDGVWVGLSYQRRWYAPSHQGPWENFEHPDGFRDMATGAVAR